jgi:hypothetical protein
LETDELAEGTKERVPAEEEDPREAPHEPLRLPVAGGESWERGVADHRLEERERERERGRRQRSGGGGG